MFGSIKDEEKNINVHGVGLGLVICKLIVNKFDGYIDFLSKFERGSTFFFTFKLDELDQISDNRKESPKNIEPSSCRDLRIFNDASKCTTLFDLVQSIKQKKSFGRERILLIDDEEFCISSMRAILFKLGIDLDNMVDFCMNGQEACELAEYALKLGMTYKLIFTDFNMPVMNGIETAARIREIFQGTD